MNIRWIGVLALMGMFGYLAFRSKSQQETIATQKNQLTDSTIILRNFRIKAGELTQENTTLAGRVVDLEKKVSGLELDKATADGNASRYLLGFRTSQIENSRLAGQLSAAQAKVAADLWTGGVGVVATTESDSSINRVVANLKGQVRRGDSTVALQAAQVAIAKQNEERADERAKEANGLVLEAEGKLLQAEGLFLTEAATKRFLGRGRKDAMRAGAEQMRAIRNTN